MDVRIEAAPEDRPLRVAESIGAADMAGEKIVFEVARPGSALEIVSCLGFSRAGLAHAFEGGALRRQAAPERLLRRTDVLREGERLTFALGRPEDLAHVVKMVGARARASVPDIWHDRFLLAADKPAGLLVHSDGTRDAGHQDTLAARVQEALCREMAASGAAGASGQVTAPRVPVAQPIQRLDVDTTGLCLFSLCPEFQPALDAQVAGHGMRKRYLALVEGIFPKGAIVIDDPIGRDRHDARRMVVARHGKTATTLVRRLEVRGRRTLVLVELGTGRRHQIRVHLASRGFPIVGDALYGRPARGGASGRNRGVPGEAEPLMLHAWQESIVHPVTGECLTFTTDWPRRFGSRPVSLEDAAR